jgi:MFS family permease
MQASFSPFKDIPAPLMAMMAEYMGLSMLLPVLGAFVINEHSGDAEWVGIIISAQYGSGMLGGVMLGALSDRIGAKKTLVFTMLVDICTFSATGFAWSIESLLVMRATAGFFNPTAVRFTHDNYLLC